jgi:DNA-binding transcriptional MerR regulator
LLQPAHIDPQTGYRYYSIRQLPRLNSILALKELGLSLEQIGPLLRNGLSPTELRAMLTMKQAQLAQSLREEESRLRHIESRIAQIDRQGGIGDYDVVVKQVAATPLLSLRCTCENMDEAVQMVRTVQGLNQASNSFSRIVLRPIHRYSSYSNSMLMKRRGERMKQPIISRRPSKSFCRALTDASGSPSFPFYSVCRRTRIGRPEHRAYCGEHFDRCGRTEIRTSANWDTSDLKSPN